MNLHRHPSDHTTESVYRYNSLAFLAGLALLLVFLLAACTSTSVEEPGLSSAETSDLVVSLSSGDGYTFPGTRADKDNHAGHKLRYIAWLYEENENSVAIVPNSNAEPSNFVKKVEQLATDGNDRVVFKGVEANKYYFVIVFADYIAADAEKDSNGHYPDKYYDTTSDWEKITLIASGNEIFNNHNLDCFSYVSGKVFKKEANKAYDVTCNLKRRVSRIDVVANGSGTAAALKDITVSKYSVIDELNLLSTSSDHSITPATSVTLTSADPDSGLLLFYYTLNADPGKALDNTEITLNPNEGYVFSKDGKHEIPGDDHQIVPEANYIYKVTGDFLNTTQVPSTVSTFSVKIDPTPWIESSENIPGTGKTE